MVNPIIIVYSRYIHTLLFSPVRVIFRIGRVVLVVVITTPHPSYVHTPKSNWIHPDVWSMNRFWHNLVLYSAKQKRSLLLELVSYVTIYINLFTWMHAFTCCLHVVMKYLCVHTTNLPHWSHCDSKQLFNNSACWTQKCSIHSRVL